MRIFAILVSIFTLLSGDYYMAQVEPYQTHSVASEVGGLVKKVALNREFSHLNRRTLIVALDTSNEDIAISHLSKKISNLKTILKLKKENRDSKAKVRYTSKYELNKETLSLLETKQNLISAQMELELKKNLREKKRFYFSNGYIGKIYVDEYEFVPPGKVLFDYYDIGKSRLDIYVPADEVENIKEKEIYINDTLATDWKIEKISRVKDHRRISTYQVRLVKKNREPKKIRFGEIVKVEFR